MHISCLNFWDEAWFFLSLRVFKLLSLSLLLFPQHFGWYVLWPSSGVCCLNFLDEDWFFFIIKSFQTIVFIFIVISTMFRPICPPAFFRCLLNSGTFMELRTTSFIESTGVACSDSVSHKWVQVLSIPVLLLACSQDWTCNLQMTVSLET